MIACNVSQESKAGLAVGKLRTHESKDVSDLAKEIVKKWKNDVDKAKSTSGTKTPVNGKPPRASLWRRFPVAV